MPRSAQIVFPFEIKLVRHSAITIDQQIANQIRSAIKEGLLRPGDHLPAIRHLSAYLGVARATLDSAYRTLIREGFITATPGRGTFVSTSITCTQCLSANVTNSTPCVAKPVSHRAQFARTALEYLSPQKNIPLAVVATSDDTSPGKDFRQVLSRKLQNASEKLTYRSIKESWRLKEQICAVQHRLRNVRADPEQIIITSGSQMGYTLAMQALFNPGDSVIFENPGYQFLQHAALVHGLAPVWGEVDAFGLCVEKVLEMAPAARGCFITPSHQHPMGVMLSLNRRKALIEWACRNQSWIIEDDYDSELRYCGNLPFPSIQGMDLSGENVIYVGTFSKMLFPGLRLGYLIVPRKVVDVFQGLSLVTYRQCNGLLEDAVAEYMAEGLYESHVRSMRGHFEKRQQVLIRTAHEDLPEWGTIESTEQGMHIILRFHNQTIDDRAVARACKREGIEVMSISECYAPGTTPVVRGLVLGFGPFQPDQIVAAVRRIAFVLRREFAPYQIKIEGLH